MPAKQYQLGKEEPSSGNIELVNIQNTHWPCYRKLYQSSEVMQYIGNPLSEQAVRQSFLLLLDKDSESSPNMTKIIKYQAKEIGLIQSKLKNNHWNLGIMLLPEYYGQGLARESHKILLEKIKKSPFFSKDKHSLMAECQAENKAANGLYKNLGFKLAKTFTVNINKVNRWEYK